MDNSHFENGETASQRGHPRATSNCQGCYQRKTKCDRRLAGCSHCAKLSTSCTYQSHKSKASQRRGPYNKDLLRKNVELEQKVTTLEATVQTLRRQVQEGSISVESQGQEQISRSPPSIQSRPPSREHAIDSSSNRDSAASDSVDGLTLSCISWDNFVTKFSHNKDDFEPGQDRDRQVTSTFSISDTAYRSKLHPNAQKLLEYWTIFKERINPLLKLVHVQAAENCLFDGKRSSDEFNICSDALRFSIYHAALTVAKELGPNLESRESELRKYSGAIKLILEEPDVLASSDLLALQALTIYLYHNQTDDEHTRYVLIGKALRMAQSLGLHRDGIILQKSPFETEMRRRLWWNIHRLERWLAENYLAHPFCVEPQFDTLLPSNINDCDISTVDGEFPKPRDGLTEMSFCLVDFELSSLTFKLLKLRPPIESDQQGQKSRLIQESLKKLTDEHLKFCDPANDFDFMITAYAKLSLSRIWLLAHQPSKYCFDRIFKDPDVKAVSSIGVQVRTLLPSALEAFEYGSELLSEPRVSQWSWIWDLPNYILVHLHFYLLEEICLRPCHPLALRTWNCLNGRNSKHYSKYIAKTPPDSLFGMFGILYSAAKRLRAREANPSTDLGQSLRKPQNTFPRFDATDSSNLAPAAWTGLIEAVSQTTLPANPVAMQSVDHIDTQGYSMIKGFNGSLLDSTVTSHPEATPSPSQGSLQLGGMSTDSGPLGFLSPSISSQELAWFQFRDENMGVEEYTDGMWEALLTDLPTMV